MHRTQNPTAPAADTDIPTVDVTPADILRGAARYLELHGWIQRDHYSNQGGPFPPACAIGAIGMAAHGRLIAIPTDFGSGVGDCRRAVDYLTAYLDDLGITTTGDEWSTEPATFYDWNDRDDQSAANVVRTLLGAADNYDRTHTPAVQRDTDRADDTGSAHDAVDAPLLDVGGYLACGCHGSQRDHTCGPLD